MKKYTTQGMNAGGRVKGYAQGGAVERAKADLGDRMRARQAEREGMTIRDRDFQDATDNAFRSGDYAPDESGRNYRYKPWNPRR